MLIFVYFLDPCLLIIFCKNERVSGLSWNFHDMSGTTQEVIISTISCLTRLFHDLQLGTVVCLWATLPLNDWTDFPEIFSLGPLLYVERSGTFGGDMLNPSNTGFIFSIFWVCLCNQQHGITDGSIFMKFSGYGHKKELTRLFYAWLDCFTLLKLGAGEVYALRVLLFAHVLIWWHPWYITRCE